MSLNLLCVICGQVIPEDRAKRGAVTDTKEHGRELNRRKRQEKAGSSCRLCGRRDRRPKMERVLTEAGEIENRLCAESAQEVQA